ncbi:reverse transcriptase zinc-binding domain-containing protein [Artemisia annua]|uniref:Reverse transcriptase zinc-binding domain-containing protein n=1 Tax=Artemisia annua TaxID=35608 RepID=A0A2U1NKM2_ARTAN|nr:reverse transcriptase zinc-binding domain-containing protein [Artemisia annua]
MYLHLFYSTVENAPDNSAAPESAAPNVEQSVHKEVDQNYVADNSAAHESTAAETVCPLCESQPDSHDRLFVECSLSSQVWLMTRDLAACYAQCSTKNGGYIVACIIPFSSKSTAWSLIATSVVAAFAYYVWQERNNRLFQKQSRRVEQLRVVMYLCHCSSQIDVSSVQEFSKCRLGRFQITLCLMARKNWNWSVYVLHACGLQVKLKLIRG